MFISFITTGTKSHNAVKALAELKGARVEIPSDNVFQNIVIRYFAEEGTNTFTVFGSNVSFRENKMYISGFVFVDFLESLYTFVNIVIDLDCADMAKR